MIDLQNAYRVYVNNKIVGKLQLGQESKPIWVDPNFYVTFTLLDSYKVKVKKGSMEETYNLSYTTSPKTPNYVKAISFVDSNNVYYYLQLISQKDSGNITTEEGYYLSNGWHGFVNQSGEEYNIWAGHYARNITSGWYFGYNIENRLAKYPLDNDMLDEAIRRLNKSFPSAHVARTTSSSVNFFEMDDYEDTWLALCTSYYDHVRIQFNYSTMVPYYGAYTTDKTTSAYKKWLGTAVHELGHTFGFADQAAHLPSIYDYGRDRTKASYLQANDIHYLKDAYNHYYGVDPAVFDVVRTPSNDAKDIAPMMLMSARSAAVAVSAGGDDDDMCMNFDYNDFDTLEDIEKFASNIVTATLTYNRREKLNIGGDLEITYDIYTINVINEEKGTLTKKELKVHLNELNIKENQKYRLYLKEYEKTPCSLIDTKSGIVEI